MTRKHTARDIPKLPKGIHCFDPTLYLRVTGTGARSWVQRITIRGRQVDRGLGGWPLVTLEDARLTALSNRRAVRAGRDPFTDRDNARTAGRTFGAAAESLIDSLKGKSANTIKMYRSVLFGTLKALTDRPVASVTRGEVIATLKAVSSVHSRGKALKLARRVLDRAVVLEWAPSNVADNGGLAAAVGVEAAAPSHHDALPWRDAPAVFGRLSAVGTAAADALAFVWLTAARLTEATEAEWSEFDLDAGVWTVPADRMKANRPHRVPLTAAAVAILERRRGQHDGLVFADRRGDVPTQHAVGRLAKADGYVTHGARSTFTDWAADAAGAPGEVAQAALAHVTANGNSTARCYARTDHLDRRRPLMDDWARFLTA